MLSLTLKPSVAIRVGDLLISLQGKAEDGTLSLGFEGPEEVLERLKAKGGVQSTALLPAAEPEAPKPAPRVPTSPSRPVLSLRRK